MLVEAGIERATCYLTNTIRCRPPGNDIKKAADALIKCQTWLAQEVRDAEPRVVITLGATASARFFPGLSVTQLSGAARVLELEGRMVVTVGTWHPSAYLRGHEESVRVAIVEALRRGKGLLER
jgi:DNA polymerase